MSRLLLTSAIRTIITITRHPYSSTATKASQSPLAVLRRKTGYPFSKCKEALTKHDNDVASAESYLKEQAQKEGWAKAEKVKGRVAKQGMIGVLVKDNKGVMVEVNCETDFVSKNKEFHKLVAEIVQSTYTNFTTLSEQASPIQHMSSDTMTTLGLKTNNNTGTLADLIAKNIGHFGENIIITRGCLTAAANSNNTLCSFVYNDTAVPNSDVVLGTYASLVMLHLVNAEGGAKTEFVKQIGVKVGQHIVGMNPAPVTRSDGEDETDERGRLVDQPYLLDASVTVGDFLMSHDLHVTDFARYELGEQ